MNNKEDSIPGNDANKEDKGGGEQYNRSISPRTETIQLKGSHVTATDVDADVKSCKEVKTVQFKETEHDLENTTSEDSLTTLTNKNLMDIDLTHMPLNPVTTFPRQLWSAEDLMRTQKPSELEQMKLQQRCTQIELREIEEENIEITQRFKKLMGMFDVFSKNLEVLDSQEMSFKAISPRRRTSSESVHKGIKPRVHVSRYAEYYSQLCAENQEKELAMLGNAARTERPITEFRDVATSSLDVTAPLGNGMVPLYAQPVASTSLSCQTSWHDNMSTSIVFSSRNDSTSTSRSELPNSLNNYAQPEAAILVCSQAQLVTQEIKNVEESKEKLIIKPQEASAAASTTELFAVNALTEQPPCNQQFHTIHIEAASSPPSSVMQRQSLCSRVWESICDFCAAMCLCLQVNRDCIFCLGFFAAFVVSASFLTAFFYRTLSVSSPLPSTSNHQLDNYNADGTF